MRVKAAFADEPRAHAGAAVSRILLSGCVARLLITNAQLSITNAQLSITNEQLSITNAQLSITSAQWTITRLTNRGPQTIISLITR